MSRIFLIALLAVIALGQPATTTAQTVPSGRDIIKKMHDRYAGHWYRTFTYDETSQTYQNGSLKTTQTCYRFFRYPDRSRIDFDDTVSGNASICRGDSSYNFTHGKVTTAGIIPDDGSVFLLGGMYFYPLNRVYAMLRDLQYDLTSCRLDHWQGRPAFVIGANGGNQLWIDSEHLYIVRMIMNGLGTIDSRYDGYTPFGGGWSPTKYSFYFNGQLMAVDTYHHCKANIPLRASLFDPAKHARSH
jgi:hypothetical protein